MPRRFALRTRLLPLALTAAALFAAEPQPYDKIITKDAKTSRGLFLVHTIGEEFYYEIPKAELDREFLWAVHIAQSTSGVGFGGTLTANLVVRWQLSGKRVLLRAVNYSVAADPQSPIASAVRASNTDTIVMSFDVLAVSPQGAPVIDVTRLFLSDVPDFGLKARLGASHTDIQRSQVERVTPYPENIEAEATQTWTRIDTAIVPDKMRPGDATIVVRHSMVRLPEKPMRVRFYDDRVGFFQTDPLYYGADEQRAQTRGVINRRRMEKLPIVYYIDAATPLKWRAWIKKGIEEWLPALEAAGFPHALEARIAPTPQEDPEFSPEDVRYSVIRWLPSTTQNAFGPSLTDPRTGEILNADIEFHQNMMNLLRQWAFIQTAPLDPGARRLPLSDDAMGRAIQMIVAHEVGHTLGLEHNVKASSLYPADKMRDREWLRTMGFTPSVMDYVRFNYVAQPEDRIPPEDLVARVGPYDRWAIHWGYAAIPNADTPEAEKPVLDKWAREQDDTPWLRYTTLLGWRRDADPGEQGEAVGDADPVASTALGLKNLKRVESMLLTGTTAATGEPLNDLSEMYNALLGHWTGELNHVVAMVGGSTSQAKNAGQPGRVFTPVPAARQKQALAFLAANAFATPAWLIDDEVLRRIEAAGELDRIRNAQAGVLANLMDSSRFLRIVEQREWSPAEFVSTLRKAVWGELRTGLKTDPYRRNLQRAWVDLAIARVNGPNTDEKALYRAELKALEAELPRIPAADRVTAAHLESVRAQIAQTLRPR